MPSKDRFALALRRLGMVFSFLAINSLKVASFFLSLLIVILSSSQKFIDAWIEKSEKSGKNKDSA